MTIRITGTGVGLPRRQVSNDELAAITGLDTTDQWITTMTGIKQRHICVDETLTDLATAAARQALAEAGVTNRQIDYLICATIGGDTRTPALACAVAERLGANCPATDVNAACAGFVYALDLAASMIRAGRAGQVLIVCAEKMSAHLDWSDRRTCVLFGDGAAACLVTAGAMMTHLSLGTIPNPTVIAMRNDMAGTNPLARGLESPSPVLMDGQRVFKHAVTIIEHEVDRALSALNLTPAEIDLYLIHQANQRIIDFAIARLDQPKTKFPTNIDRYGNISAVSLPLLLHELRQDGRLKAGQRLFLCAFGAGMTYGSCVWDWE